MIVSHYIILISKVIYFSHFYCRKIPHNCATKRVRAMGRENRDRSLSLRLVLDQYRRFIWAQGEAPQAGAHRAIVTELSWESLGLREPSFGARWQMRHKGEKGSSPSSPVASGFWGIHRLQSSSCVLRGSGDQQEVGQGGALEMVVRSSFETLSVNLTRGPGQRNACIDSTWKERPWSWPHVRSPT